jgi:homospermidine synthase
MIGCGTIGQAVLPMLLRHGVVAPERITILAGDARGQSLADAHGIAFRETPLTRDNHRAILEPLLGPGDFLLNLSVEVESLALVRLAAERGAFYLDSGLEPWPGGYTDTSVGPAQRTNYAFREQALRLKAELGRGRTAVIGQGANPGLVSQLVKVALLTLARDLGRAVDEPAGRDAWAALAQGLGVRAIHIAERDSQIEPGPRRPGEFVSTWSIDGFLGEGCQPAELGWGTHERSLPPDGHRHAHGCGSAIWLMRPGAGTRVRSWTPGQGPMHGWLITHMEAISIADYLTLRRGGELVYRPTVHYAYRPCDASVLSLHELAARNWAPPEGRRVLNQEITDGVDELGVLLAGHARNAFWFGSRLSIHEARRLVPHANATAVQVAAGVLAGIVGAVEAPDRGLIEPEELDHRRALQVARPYLGEILGAYTGWTPLEGRGTLFAEDLQADDPWQFANVRVL